MPKLKPLDAQTCSDAFQVALDALDVIGRWDWDAATDCVRADGFVALLFNLDPEESATGIALTAYIDALHPDDRARVLGLLRRSAQEGSTYLTEYRVGSADGRTRWVLARGRFICDHTGRPLSGSGILVDITQMRVDEGTFNAVETHACEAPLDRAVDHAIAVQEAVVELQDAKLKILSDALLMELGRRLAQQEVRERHRRMN